MMHHKDKVLNKAIKVMIMFMFIPICLSSIGYSQQAVDLNKFIQNLKDEDPYVRRKAAAALGEIKDARAVEPLIAALKDQDNYVRWGAAKALGEIKDAHAVEPLIAALKDKKFRGLGVTWVLYRIRDVTAWALGEIKDVRAVEPLIAALKDQDNDVRWEAAEALGKIGTSAVEPLISVLKDQDSGVREEAAWALGCIKDARAVESLIAALKDENLAALAGAYAFFIERGESGTEAVLIKALNTYGDKWMAEAFLNSGNSQLEEAARNWAIGHGYKTSSSSFGKGGPRWRSGR